jgi:type VI secretion system protein ImpA
MMTDEWKFSELLTPIAGEQPCGENLEDSLLLASFDAYRVFGQMVPFDKPPDWREIRRNAAEALQKSRDYRLLAHLASASLWIDGPRPFLSLLNVAAHWLENYWSSVYPLIDDDAILRKNAINCFADRIAVIDGLRRLPLVKHPQLGAFAMREIELILGTREPGESETEERDAAQLSAAFAATDVAEVQALHSEVAAAVNALGRIETKMREEGGAEAAPAFDALLAQLRQIERVITDQLSQHPGAPAGQSGAGTDPSTNESVSAAAPARNNSSGGLLAIQSRQDAIRAMDAVSSYFRQFEPSSPIPLLLERAKRLVAKDFFEVLADIAPDALAQAKAAGGIRDEE